MARAKEGSGFVNDGFGSKTAAGGTEFSRVIPPRTGVRARIAGFSYTAGATAHTLTQLNAVDEVSLTSDAASGQAVININKAPTAPDGSVMANTDWFIVQHEDGNWEDYKISSVSGLAVTLTANLDKKVLTGSRAFFMGQPSDHSDRQFTIDASQTLTISGGDDRNCIGAAGANNQPIMFHSDNGTNAGIMRWLSYIYGGA